jgi:hypothetical protein
MTEFKSIKFVALKLFYLYKMLGVITIPLITLLFIDSTANLLSTGAVTNHNFDIAWAVIYAVCFEMNGLRLIVDARLEQLTQRGNGVIDYILGVFLVSLGVMTTLIEGLVNSQALAWAELKNVMWAILLTRSVAILGMIVRECVHYAPLILSSVVDHSEVKHERIEMDALGTSKSRVSMDEVQNTQAQNVVPVAHIEGPVEVPQVCAETVVVSTVVGDHENTAGHNETQTDQPLLRNSDTNSSYTEVHPVQPMENEIYYPVDTDNSDNSLGLHGSGTEGRHGVNEDERPIPINYGDQICDYLATHRILASQITPSQKNTMAEVIGCTRKTVDRKITNLRGIELAQNARAK